MGDFQLDFFNFEISCPEEIPNCESLRQEYKTELEKYKSQNICNACIERSLRNKYLTFIMATVNKK